MVETQAAVGDVALEVGANFRLDPVLCTKVMVEISLVDVGLVATHILASVTGRPRRPSRFLHCASEWELGNQTAQKTCPLTSVAVLPLLSPKCPTFRWYVWCIALSGSAFLNTIPKAPQCISFPPKDCSVHWTVAPPGPAFAFLL